jgi:hypothetical protein
MIKINSLDAHDRLKEYNAKPMSADIVECCQDLIRQEPFGKRPFYIFAHARTDDDGVTKRIIWQPRLFKPKAQTNSMLFRAYPPSDAVGVIWIIPARELWSQYEKGKLTENKTILEFIDLFENNRVALEQPLPDEPSEAEAKDIYNIIVANAKRDRMIKSLYGI